MHAVTCSSTEQQYVRHQLYNIHMDIVISLPVTLSWHVFKKYLAYHHYATIRIDSLYSYNLYNFNFKIVEIFDKEFRLFKILVNKQS